MKGEKMNLAFGLEVIDENAEFHLNDQDKAGIAGVNGAGKITLSRLLPGEALDYFDQYEAEDILLTLVEDMKIDPDLLNRPLTDPFPEM